MMCGSMFGARAEWKKGGNVSPRLRAVANVTVPNLASHAATHTINLCQTVFNVAEKPDTMTLTYTEGRIYLRELI